MNRTQYPAAKTFVILLAVILVAGAVFCVWRFHPVDAQQAALRERALVMEIFASRLVSGGPAKRVLIVGNPFTRMPGASSTIVDAESSSVAGLRRGLGVSAKVMGPLYPKLRPEAVQDPASVPMPPGTSTPLSYLTAEGEWDRLIAETGSVDLVVSLIGIPGDLEKHAWWRAPSGPKLALLLPDFRVLGDPSRVDEVLQSGRIAGAVLPLKGALSQPGSDRGLTSFRESVEGSFRVLTAGFTAER